MNDARFEALVRTLTTAGSRRHAARILGGSAIAVLGFHDIRPTEGKHRRHRHHRIDTTGTCDASTSPCGSPACNNRDCACYVRAQGGFFCGTNVGQCADCAKDADCVASMGCGAACVSYADGGAICGSSCAPSHRACIQACAPPA